MRKSYRYDRKKGKVVVTRRLTTRHDKITGLPTRYTYGLTPAQRIKYKKSIEKTRKYYYKTGLVKERAPINKSKTPKRSSHSEKFEKKYGYKVTDLSKLHKEFPDTDIEEILAKGRAAFATGGSRNTVYGNGGSFRWAYARLASVLTAGRALAVDKDLVGPKSLRKIYKR